MNLKVMLGCSNGHMWEAAKGAATKGQKSVSIKLSKLAKVCPGCGNAVAVVRVQMK